MTDFKNTTCEFLKRFENRVPPLRQIGELNLNGRNINDYGKGFIDTGCKVIEQSSRNQNLKLCAAPIVISGNYNLQSHYWGLALIASGGAIAAAYESHKRKSKSTKT